MFTSQSSSLTQAISWTWISPVTREDARQVARVMVTGRLDLRGDLGRTFQEPDLAGRADRDPAVSDGHAHGAFKVMK